MKNVLVYHISTEEPNSGDCVLEGVQQIPEDQLEEKQELVSLIDDGAHHRLLTHKEYANLANICNMSICNGILGNGINIG